MTPTHSLSPPPTSLQHAQQSSSSPMSYTSSRSLSNPPHPPSLDHSSIPSTESDSIYQQQQQMPKIPKRIGKRQQSNSGVAQGVQLLERQQADWERKKERDAARYSYHAARNRNPISQRSLQSTDQQQQQQQQLYPSHSATANNNNAKNNSYPQQYQMYSGSGGGGGTSSSMGGKPQDHGSGSHASGLSVEGVPTTVHLSGDGDDVSESLKDEATSKTVGQGKKDMKRVNSIGKFLKTPLKSTQSLKRSISNHFSSDPTTINTNDKTPSTMATIKPILSGYLNKRGRNGKWQKRYFESDGTSLLYYKSKNKKSILATLDLLHVGNIQLDFTDEGGQTFYIEVKGRNYHLYADTKERARDWVINLNRVKEARMQIGGLKLIEPRFENKFSGLGNDDGRLPSSRSLLDGRDEMEDDQVAARVVIYAARPRSRGLGKDDFSEMERSLDEQNYGRERTSRLPTMSPASDPSSMSPTSLSKHTLAVGNAVHQNIVVRWTKRRSAIQNWTRRLSRWAKRLTMVRCIVKDDVVHFPDHATQQDGYANYLKDNNDGSTNQHFDGIQQDPYTSVAPHYPSYLEPHSERSRQSNEMSANDNIVPNSWQPSQPNRLQLSLEPSMQDDVGGSSIQSSSGRVTPIQQEDDERSGVIA